MKTSTRNQTNLWQKEGEKLGCCGEIIEVMDKGFYFSICKCEETGPEVEKYK